MVDKRRREEELGRKGTRRQTGEKIKREEKRE